MRLTVIDATPYQGAIKKQLRAVLARDKRLVNTHKEGGHFLDGERVVNCPGCRRERGGK